MEKVIQIKKIIPGAIWGQRCFDDKHNAGACRGVTADYVCDNNGQWLRWATASGQWVATILAVAGVMLNNARIRWCFPLWFVSNVISLLYHLRARLWGLVVRDMIFIVLAVAGWFQWG